MKCSLRTVQISSCTYLLIFETTVDTDTDSFSTAEIKIAVSQITLGKVQGLAIMNMYCLLARLLTLSEPAVIYNICLQ